MRICMAMVLAGCHGVPGLEVDTGTVTVTCTFDYTVDGEHETGDYPGFTTDCEGWAGSGEQALHSTWARCEEEGLEGGADEASCECVEDTGTCRFPHDVND